MPFHLYAANEVVPGSAPNVYRATERITPRRIAESCVVAESYLFWPNEVLSMAVLSMGAAWVFIVGLLNALSVGCINSAASASVMNDVTIFTRHSLPSDAS